MEAVSKGAAQAGGHVIGVTCDQIERWRPVQPNAWVKEELRYETQRERLFHLIELGQALIAMPGGVGTLSEIVLAWSLMQTGEIPERPLVVVGEGWRVTFEAFLRESEPHLYPQDAEMLSFAADHEVAADTIIKLVNRN
jgi:predicted Rossmann-fold nucleotide-binding protein